MKLETFFEKFDELADTPNGVKSMRELVLRLALNGSVIGLDSSKWDRVSLGSLGDWGSGGTPLRSEPQYYGGSIPWLIIGDLNDGIVTSASTFITEEGLANSSARLLPKGVLLIAMYGSIGKLGITGIECATNQAIAFCKPDPKRVDLRYLFHTIKGIQPALLARGQGLAQKNISQTILKAWEISLPPLAEQKRIVAKVDELMALCDRLEAQQKEREEKHAALARASLARFADAPTPANLNFIFHPSYTISPADLRKSILTLAVQGKLVPQDPNDEPAEASIEQVSKDAKRAIRDGIIRRHGLEETPDDSDMADLPFGWRWTRLVEATRPVQYAIKRGPFGSTIRKDMFVSSGFKIYEQQHAIYGDFTKGRYYINEAKFDELRAFELHPGEILVSCSGTVGKVAIVPADIERGIINQALLKLSLHQSAVLNEYFLILFPAFFMETDTLTNLSGTAQKNIPGMDVLKAMPFPLPPLAEQRRIVAKVDQLMALVDELETQLAASRTAAANFLSALVAELTGTPNNRKISAQSSKGTGRRGRPPKS